MPTPSLEYVLLRASFHGGEGGMKQKENRIVLFRVGIKTKLKNREFVEKLGWQDG
jgi:hypothetical protein